MTTPQFYYSPSTVVYLWGYIDVVRYKWQIGFLGVGEFFFMWPIIVMWAIGAIPSVESLWHYCAIYYVVYFPIWIVNIVMSDSRSAPLFLFAFFGNAFVFIVTSFVWGMVWYALIQCWSGAVPVDCRDNQLAELLLAFFTGILWIIALFEFLAYLAIIGRIRQTNSARSLTLHKVTT